MLENAKAVLDDTWADASELRQALREAIAEAERLQRLTVEAAEHMSAVDEENHNLRAQLKLAQEYARRYHFVRDIVTGADNMETDAKTAAIAAALMAGKDGDEAIDAALAASTNAKEKT